MNALFPSASGIDFSWGMRIFGSDNYLRFLRRFPQDDTLSRLCAALEKGDVSEAFLCAHNLKGLTRQLGIVGLSGPASTLCDLLRPQNPDVLPRACSMATDLQTRYARIVDLIGRL